MLDLNNHLNAIQSVLEEKTTNDNFKDRYSKLYLSYRGKNRGKGISYYKQVKVTMSLEEHKNMLNIVELLGTTNTCFIKLAIERLQAEITRDLLEGKPTALQA